MLTVKDIYPIGDALSVTLEGDTSSICNGTLLKDTDGNLIKVLSVAMVRHNDAREIKKFTTILTTLCNLKKGSELFIA